MNPARYEPSNLVLALSRVIHAGLLAVALLLVCAPALAADDPLNSPLWDFMHQTMLNGEPYEFDSRVLVMAPSSAEDALNVPVSFRVESLGDVKKVVVFADLNPIHKVLVYYPQNANPALGFRLKIEQATPIRAAALTADGIWHVGSAWVDAAGGGCTAPSYGRTSGTWVDTLGEVRHRRWQSDNAASERLRLQVMHPMDTGLADGIPAFYLERLELTDDAGESYATLEIFEPVSENPYFSFDLRADAAGRALNLSGRDLNGNRIDARLD